MEKQKDFMTEEEAISTIEWAIGRKLTEEELEKLKDLLAD